MKPKDSRIFVGADGTTEYEVRGGAADWQAALYCFGMTPHGEMKLRHWKNFVACVWPDPVFVWDEWADLSFGALCGAKKTVERVTGKQFAADFPWWKCVIFTGAGSTGKSARAALWMLGNWLVAQEHTACILTSTSMDLLAKRIWAVMLRWIDLANVRFPLRSIPSDLELRWNDDDRLHAVFGVAVKSGGNPQEAVDRIKGIHARRTFIAIDEMTSVPQAIVSASRNIRIGTDESQLIGLANAISHNDPHGERSHPRDGWDSISVEDTFWITKYGCAVHLDAMKSPAMTDPKRFHFYPNKETLEDEAREIGGLNSPDGWSNIRGFWSPTGASNTVMDEALLDQFNTKKPAIWKGNFEMGAAFDVAFEGGDRRILYPFKFGEFASGLTGIEFQPPIIVEVDMTQDKRFLHYQIADAVQSLCENYAILGKPFPIPPDNFTMDVTGEGAGPFGIMSGRWSDRIQSVEFGGAAPKEQVAPNRPATWHELYGNRVTMLWYCLRRFIEGDQVRGLIEEGTLQELTSRTRFMRAGKIVVTPKSEMKLTKNRSPDKGDAAVIAAEFLRRKGVSPAGIVGGGSIVDFSEWNELVAQRTRHDARSYEDPGAAYA